MMTRDDYLSNMTKMLDNVPQEHRELLNSLCIQVAHEMSLDPNNEDEFRTETVQALYALIKHLLPVLLQKVDEARTKGKEEAYNTPTDSIKDRISELVDQLEQEAWRDGYRNS